MSRRRIDRRNLNKKVSLFRTLPDVSKKLHTDAAAFLVFKIVDDVLNGQAGPNYPKVYPAGVSEAARGFVGVVTGALKASIQFENVSKFQTDIFPNPTGTVAPYFRAVGKWAAERYGLNYMEIAAELYGPQIERKMKAEITRFIKAVSLGNSYTYQNPF